MEHFVKVCTVAHTYILPIVIIILLIDINECVRTDNDCDVNAECSNTDSSYNCSCNPGFLGNGSFCCELVIFSVYQSYVLYAISFDVLQF